ncbi:MAG: hypothetical protein QOE63_146 [Acidimicrobiaceae bacterium]
MLLAVLVTLLVIPSATRHAAAAPGTLPLVEDAVVGGDPRLHELTLQSPALGRSAKVRVLLPSGYDDPANADARYPMLLLLHGVGDDQSSWTNHTDIAAFTASTPLIIVMPEAGKTPDSGWYSDWINGGPAWESFHIGELLPFVDATYRTIGTREARAVAGFSMGGFGAMSYAARHPELFVAAATFSGAVDTTFAGAPESTVFALLHSAAGTPSDAVWGPYATDETPWRTHNPTDLATNLRWTNLYIATGNGVPGPGDNPATIPLEVGVLPMNLSFDAALTAQQVPHVSNFRPSGTHDWPYRQLDFHAWLPMLLDVLAAPPAPPAAFDYRSAEPTFSAWGWSFATDRPGPQFVDLDGVSPAGLTATGSGPLALDTPTAYPPGSLWTVRGDDGASIVVAADASGRLAFTIDLGPGHAAPSSLVAGVRVDALADDPRVTRSVTISAAPPGAVVTPTGASATTTGTTPARLPATGGELSLGWLAVALLATTGAARWCRGRASPR